MPTIEVQGHWELTQQGKKKFPSKTHVMHLTEAQKVRLEEGDFFGPPKKGDYRAQRSESIKPLAPMNPGDYRAVVPGQ
jgi:hypothetical protein